MNIEIEGLSPRQIDLANRIWAMESMEEILEFFDALPRKAKIDAYVVYLMIVWAYMDQEDVGECAEARELIERVRAC